MAISVTLRAEAIWRKIQRKPTAVVFTKPRVVTKSSTTPETQLAAQILRVNSDNRPSAVEGVAGLAPRRQAVVYGVTDHPTVADTDMAEGYTFLHEGDHYRCVDVIVVPGGLQGIFVVNG
jgi:hypothetical protein